MALRSDLDALLRQLEIDIQPILEREGMNSFFRVFEDRSEMILGGADRSEKEYVLDCFMIMLRKSGVRDVLKGPMLH